ncbi:unnamed protein product [Rhizophagus irregularis]|uniref:Uncharacterized protein n=1 Tax=Rhizophagus irregularis TaxID=588596 RepID=A0A915YYP9_9GLOM|nr:unnamed protein product [Rhizophagus irregularis]
MLLIKCYTLRNTHSALSWASEVQKSKDSFGTRVGFQRLEIQRIRSALGFGTGVTSEKWKKPSFVSGVSGGIPKNRIPKDSFFLVLGRWIYRFGLRFLGVEYTDFSSWILDIWV